MKKKISIIIAVIVIIALIAAAAIFHYLSNRTHFNEGYVCLLYTSGIAPGEPVHLHQKCQVNRSGYLKNILLRHFQFIL